MPIGQALAGLLPGIGVAGGAALGSIYPGVGTALGAQVGGALGSGLGGLYNNYANQNSPEAQARNQLMQQLQGPSTYQRANFDPIANEEIRRFKRDVLPGISENFAGMNGINSSAYRQALSGAGQDLQTRLAALRSQHERDENQFMSGAEERRRQMLGDLSGGMLANRQTQMQNSLSGMNQFLTGVPGTIMDQARFKADVNGNWLRNALSQLGYEQTGRQNNVNQANTVVDQALVQRIENLIQQDPTNAQAWMALMGQVVGGGFNAAFNMGTQGLANRGAVQAAQAGRA